MVLNPDSAGAGACRIPGCRIRGCRIRSISEAEAVRGQHHECGICRAALAESPAAEPDHRESAAAERFAGNPRLQNDAVANPGVVSVNPTNTTVEAPRLQNPRLAESAIAERKPLYAAFADSSLSLTNDGNTTDRLHRRIWC